MEELFGTALFDMGLYFALVLIYTVVGAYQNINIWSMKWDWKLWLNGVVKHLVFGGTVVATAVVSAILIAQAEAQGVILTNISEIAPNFITGIVMVASSSLLCRIVKKLSTKFGLTEEQVKELQSRATQGSEAKVMEIDDLPEPPEDYECCKKYNEFGLGRAYSFDIASYDIFKAQTDGKFVDIDGYFGAQCWDGCAVLWQQLGRNLSTGGTGQARGCWTVEGARMSNAGSEFELITDKRNIKRGDVVVFNSGRYGHIAFADENYNGENRMKFFGENQGGYNGSFNTTPLSLASFLGAFRLKQWNKPTPQPTPIVKPAEKPAVAPQPAKPAPAKKPAKVPNNQTTKKVVEVVDNKETVTTVVADKFSVGQSVWVEGCGTGDSYGGGAKTRSFKKTKMKIIGVNNNHYACNQFNQGTVGNLVDVTGWWKESQLKPIK